MNIEAVLADFQGLPDTARVWVYQSSRPFSEAEQATLAPVLAHFVADWTAHAKQLTAAAAVVLGQFIILAVDESRTTASGCSIDKSVHFLQNIEQKYHISLFERMTFAYWHPDGVRTAPAAGFADLYKAGTLQHETLVFDNLVTSLGDLRRHWLKPLMQSWHKRFV